MKVTNRAQYPLIAFGVDTRRGYGRDVTILPDETREVSGPYLGEMDGDSCHIHIPGNIACHEAPDDENAFQVLEGMPLCLRADHLGVTVRHHLDAVEPQVAAWREQNCQ